MGFGRLGLKAGRAILKAQRGARRLGEGLEDVFGEDMTRPSDGFSQRRTLARATASVNRNKAEKLNYGTRKSFDFSTKDTSKVDLLKSNKKNKKIDFF